MRREEEGREKRRRKKWKGGKVEESRRRMGEFREEVEGRVEGVERVNTYSMTLP